ncbi:MAG: helix-turn-helix domain-containing protein [Dehalococcoidia bacterium]
MLSKSIETCQCCGLLLAYASIPSHHAQDDVANSKEAPPYLTLQETCEWLRMSHQTIYKLMREGMPSHKVGQRRIFFRDEIEAWLRSRRA